jgi:hypothetical protein
VKRLGLAYTPFGASVPLFKRLGSRFSPKNSSFWRRVEKVGLKIILLSGLIATASRRNLTNNFIVFREEPCS